MHTGWKYQNQTDPMDKLSTWAIVAGAVGAYLVVKGLIYIVSSPVILLTTAA